MKMKLKRKIFYCILLSILFIIVFPIIKNKVLDKKYTVYIETTGDKNDLSKGTEIWIDSISKDGVLVANESIALQNGWEFNGRIFSPGNKKYKLKLNIRYRKNAKIKFIKHEYSGIVNIIDGNGNKLTVDLYSSKQEIYEYDLNKK